ncbi:aldo/keto reductase [Lactiplantibacillus carotarum]|uniref:aldo/keto reductase n=1 Tax=Lactiplantibacillus carotarum TaxID=2993456 RepID=UPI00298EF245|nr:aldo/keto reductase [Lactiplantibacillus carotarum]
MRLMNDNHQIPEVGFGAMIYDDDTTEAAVTQALNLGYRLIDTAETYGTETGVGTAIQKSAVSRDDIFLTSKLWPNAEINYAKTIDQFKASLQRLKQDYLDLYLIHEPYGNVAEEWRALEDLQAAGLIRSIGVSNFNQTQLAELMATARVRPAVDQIESHPWFNQNELVAYCQANHIIPEAWASLAEGRHGIFQNQTLTTIAAAHHKSVAQIILRWDLQRGLVPLAKSESAARVIENQTIFDFELSQLELNQVNQLNTNTSLYPSY